MFAIEGSGPGQHAIGIDVQEGAEAGAGGATAVVATVELGDAVQQRPGHLGRRRLPAPNRLARLARGPLMDRAAHPITFGTRNRPEARTASGALRRAASRLSDGRAWSGRSVG